VNDQPPVVFVGHEATRTGAPGALLHIVRWFRANTSIDFRIVLLEGGPVVDDFRAVAPTQVLNLRRTVYSYNLFEALLVHARLERIAVRLRGRRVKSKMRKAINPSSVVYANSAESARVVMFGTPEGELIVHLHEMEVGVRSTMGSDTTKILTSAAHVIVASQRVLQDLEEWHPAVVEHCTVVYECIDVAATQSGGHESNEGLRATLGIPAGAGVVIGCGSLEWRKGFDLFLVVAARVARELDTEVFFLWVGGTPYPTQLWQIELDVWRAGLDGMVSFVSSVPNPADYLALGDVFLLTSREDPFPLVCVEAAALGKPIVCFDSAGTVELVEDDAGVAVPHLDVTAMADAVVELLKDPGRRAELGRVGQKRAWTYDVGMIVPKILELVSETLDR
jgi:glycosyltransferase involved in cell wall biosynthesis